LDDTIDALVPDWPVLDAEEHAAAAARCTRFIRTLLRLAPLHVRIGFRLMFAAYTFYAFACHGPFPSRLQRSAALTEFSALPFPMVGALERLLRSMTLLAFFEQPSVLSALGEETPAGRQLSHRAKRAAQVRPVQ
jgi:hypothetical protein